MSSIIPVLLMLSLLVRHVSFSAFGWIDYLTIAIVVLVVAIEAHSSMKKKKEEQQENDKRVGS